MTSGFIFKHRRWRTCWHGWYDAWWLLMEVFFYQIEPDCFVRFTNILGVVALYLCCNWYLCNYHRPSLHGVTRMLVNKQIHYFNQERYITILAIISCNTVGKTHIWHVRKVQYKKSMMPCIWSLRFETLWKHAVHQDCPKYTKQMLTFICFSQNSSLFKIHRTDKATHLLWSEDN